jgi:hypothetical protein
MKKEKKNNANIKKKENNHYDLQSHYKHGA